MSELFFLPELQARGLGPGVRLDYPLLAQPAGATVDW